MKRILHRRAEWLESTSYALVAGTLFACTVLAFTQPAPGASPAPQPVVSSIRLEGLVVTPRGTYRASEWRQKLASRALSPRLADADNRPLRQCAVRAPAPPKGLLC